MFFPVWFQVPYMIVDGNKSTRQPYKTTVYNHGRRIDLANQLDDDVYDDDGGESKNFINSGIILKTYAPIVRQALLW